MVKGWLSGQPLAFAEPSDSASWLIRIRDVFPTGVKLLGFLSLGARPKVAK